MHIYTLPRVPGATITTPWETFCHSRNPFIVIRYSEHRATSRWQHVERERKFGVTYFRPSVRGYNRNETTWYMTLEKAESAASKLMAEKTADWGAAQDDGWRGRNRAGDTDLEWLKKDGEKP